MKVVRTALLIAVLAAGCSAAASTPVAARSNETSTRSPSAGSASADTERFSDDPRALAGHGELAAVNAGRLHLVGSRTPGVEVALDGQASGPAWSHDGRWLTVVTRPAPPRSQPYTDEPTTIWLVSRTGKVIRRLTPHDRQVRDAEASWSPSADRVALTYYSRGKGHVDVVVPSGSRKSLVVASNVSWVAWSPSGTRLAVGRNRFVKPAAATSWVSEIDVMSPSGAGRRVIARDRGGVYDVAGWWPDGSAVLAWIDPMGSGSIAADGLPLYDFGLNGGRRRLGRMLQYRPWMSTSKADNTVAFIAGGDRELTNGRKHLVVCSPTSCRAVAQPKSVVSFDPAYSRAGRLAVVRDKAVRPTAANGGFGPAYTAKVDASGGIGLLAVGSVRPWAVGKQATAPVWGRDDSMLMVRRVSLWLKPATSAKAVRVAGPLGLANDSDYFAGDPWEYYGFIGWWDSFAWSEAVRQM